MSYYHIVLEYKDNKEDQSLKDFMDLEYIKKNLILPYMRKTDKFIFNGKNIELSNLKGIRIYKSNEDLSTSSQRSLARYPNIIGWAGYDYSLTNEISNDVFSSCQVIISKEEDDKKKEEKKIKKIKNIFFWAGCGIFLIFTIYSILCLFPFMEDYNIFKLMNLEGNAANIIGIVIGPIYTIITNKYLIKS